MTPVELWWQHYRIAVKSHWPIVAAFVALRYTFAPPRRHPMEKGDTR